MYFAYAKTLRRIGAAAGLLICGSYAYADGVDVYTSYADNGPPGIYLPGGPDENLSLEIKCPGAITGGTKFVLPAGSTTSRYVATAMAAPLFQNISLSLTQNYAVLPTEILWRLTLGSVGVSGYIGPNNEISAQFDGPDCTVPWHVNLVSSPISGAYSPSSSQGITPAMTPFPQEP